MRYPTAGGSTRGDAQPFMTRLGDLLFEPLRKAARERVLAENVAQTRIVATELGPRASSIGGATLVLEQALAKPTLFAAG